MNGENGQACADDRHDNCENTAKPGTNPVSDREWFAIRPDKRRQYLALSCQLRRPSQTLALALTNRV
jgi:hypothetical protein